MDKKIIIYTTPSCVYCKMAKDFFNENNISYQEYDLYENPDKKDEMFEKSGQMGVPVIDINGEILVGFDKSRLNKILVN